MSPLPEERGSRHAIDVVRDVWDAWARGDSEAVFALYAPDIEWAMYPGATMPDDVVTVHGHEGVRRYHRELLEVWRDYVARPEHLDDLGDRVLVRAKVSGVGKLGGVPGEITVWHVWEVRDGKVVRVHGHPTEAEALAASPAAPSGQVELARRFMEFRSDDWSRLELLAENVVYRPIAETTESGEHRGREGYRRYMEAFFESGWAKDLRIASATFREHGPAVVVRTELSGRGRTSGVDFRARVFVVLTFADGRIVRIEDFLDRDAALAAAGRTQA